ncbi:MAG: sel1 repeat family protein [Emcibacter sp.]|nr:sel1 repeat family protein [Emcibacter sp.]
MKKIILLLVIPLLISCSDKEEPTIEELIKQAEEGDAKSQFDLGLIYFESEGDESFDKAYQLIESSANLDYAEAQNEIGNFYSDACPDKCRYEQDYREAMKWYQMAARQGDSYAQYNIGDMFMLGHGVEPDPVKAFVWYKRSAKNGYRCAKIKVSEMLFQGNAVDKNELMGMVWLFRAMIIDEPYCDDFNIDRKTVEPILDVKE